MIFPGGMNKITSHQLHEKFSDLKLVRRELPIQKGQSDNDDDTIVGTTRKKCGAGAQ